MIINMSGLLGLFTMGDPCPRCGSTEFYCAKEVDLRIDHLLAEIARLQELVSHWRFAYTEAKGGDIDREEALLQEIARLRGLTNTDFGQ